MSIEQLANYGVLGLVLGWFMLRLEKKLDKVDDTITKLSEAIQKWSDKI